MLSILGANNKHVYYAFINTHIVSHYYLCLYAY